MASMLGRRATTKSPTLSGGNSPQVLRANIAVPLSVRPGAPSRPSYRTIHLEPALRHAASWCWQSAGGHVWASARKFGGRAEPNQVFGRERRRVRSGGQLLIGGPPRLSIEGRRPRTR